MLPYKSPTPDGSPDADKLHVAETPALVPADVSVLSTVFNAARTGSTQMLMGWKSPAYRTKLIKAIFESIGKFSHFVKHKGLWDRISWFEGETFKCSSSQEQYIGIVRSAICMVSQHMIRPSVQAEAQKYSIPEDPSDPASRQTAISNTCARATAYVLLHAAVVLIPGLKARGDLKNILVRGLLESSKPEPPVPANGAKSPAGPTTREHNVVEGPSATVSQKNPIQSTGASSPNITQPIIRSNASFPDPQSNFLRKVGHGLTRDRAISSKLRLHASSVGDRRSSKKRSSSIVAISDPCWKRKESVSAPNLYTTRNTVDPSASVTHTYTEVLKSYSYLQGQLQPPSQVQLRDQIDTLQVVHAPMHLLAASQAKCAPLHGRAIHGTMIPAQLQSSMQQYYCQQMQQAPVTNQSLECLSADDSPVGAELHVGQLQANEVERETAEASIRARGRAQCIDATSRSPVPECAVYYAEARKRRQGLAPQTPSGEINRKKRTYGELLSIPSDVFEVVLETEGFGEDVANLSLITKQRRKSILEISKTPSPYLQGCNSIEWIRNVLKDTSDNA